MREPWLTIVLSLLALQAYFVKRAVRRHRTLASGRHVAVVRAEPLTGAHR